MCTPLCASLTASVRSSITGIADFKVLGQLHPPSFCVVIAGIIAEVGDINPTMSGSGKFVRTMVLSDPKGCHVVIKQLGSGEVEPEVQKHSHVIVYFVTGAKAHRDGVSGSLWAYGDSIIKVQSMLMFVPNCVKEVDMLAE